MAQSPDRRPNSQPARPAAGQPQRAQPIARAQATPSIAPPGSFPGAFPAAATTGVPSRLIRKKVSLWKSPLVWSFVLLAGGAAGGGWWWMQQRELELLRPDDQRGTERTPLTAAVKLKSKGIRPDELKFELVSGPTGATVDPKTGTLSWTPAEEDGPAKHEVKIRVSVGGAKPLSSETTYGIVVDEANAAPELAAVADGTLNLDEADSLTLDLAGSDTDLPKQKLRYQLLEGAQAGGEVESATGKFTLNKGLAKPGQTLAFTVAVKDSTGAQSQPVKFQLTITGSPPPYDAFLARAKSAGFEMVLLGTDPFPLFDVPGKVHSFERDRLSVYEFPTPASAAKAAELVAPNAADIAGKPIPYAREAEVYLQGKLIYVFLGATAPPATLTSLLGKQIGDRTPAVVAAAMPAETTKPTSLPMPVVEKKSLAAQYEPLIALYKQKKLFSPKEYSAIRKFQAAKFATEQAAVIKEIIEPDAALSAFLEKNVDLREELYTAIDPKQDDVPAALRMFQEIHRRFPAKLKNYGDLAIAIAVTWDNDKNLYDYDHHSRRTHSIMPEQLAGALDNFQYYVDAEPYMQGRIQYMPWEFLMHGVNDRTPIQERMWAFQNYVQKRVMFGECYSHVPYDDEMLRTESRVCKLDGKPYTLENLRTFGGVCAMQADFAARVGKSLGVPAEYVRGQGNLGGHHAWVMWVELKNVTPTSIVFSLESHGRYNTDFYYVGTLKEPQTGKEMTDRQLELRLQTVGLDVRAKRQAERIMAAYPVLRDELKLTTKEQLTFLSDLLKLCVGNEDGWHALATLSKENELPKSEQTLLITALDSLFITFAKVPDFTWEVFDDLISFRKNEKDRIALYQKLVQLYDAAKRPDLACQAAAKLADKLAGEKRHLEACQGLMGTVFRYPTEGRYVPKLVDQMDKLSRDLPNADQQLAEFYRKFLPTIPKARSSTPSTYCIAMYEKGIAKFRSLNLTADAEAAEAELVKIRGIGK